MLRPTMLRHVALACCDRLAGALNIVLCTYKLGGVYMIWERLSSRHKFTLVPSYGSVFVYMLPTQNVMPARVQPGSCAGARFSSRTKIHSSVM